MKITKQNLCSAIDNAIVIRDEVIASDIDKGLLLIDRLPREQKLARLINIAEALERGETIEIIN